MAMVRETLYTHSCRLLPSWILLEDSKSRRKEKNDGNREEKWKKKEGCEEKERYFPNGLMVDHYPQDLQS